MSGLKFVFFWICLIGAVHCATIDQPFVSTSIVVLTNSSVELECIPDLYFPGYKVAWRFGIVSIQINSTADPSFWVKYETYDKLRNDSGIVGQTLGQVFILKINRLQINDTGEYSCRLPDRLVIDGDQVQTTNLTVRDACPPGHWACSDGRCIVQESRCDGLYHCSDKSDEFNCNGNCSSAGYMCSDNKTCISSHYRCDSVVDCPDQSDEANCAYECFRDEFLCKSGECIAYGNLCDGIQDCKDNSDELNCKGFACGGNFQCLDKKCLKTGELCDGIVDCVDGTDERGCNVSRCQPEQIFCLSGECLALGSLCDGVVDCQDGSDEKFCQNCHENATKCLSGECLPSELICDGTFDCMDGSDEFHCDSEPCRNGSAKCQNGACYEISSRCDGNYQCSDGSDEITCLEVCKRNEFRCRSGMCMAVDFRCDGKKDCPDGSDEESCYENCPQRTFRCASRECLSAVYFCNGIRDCADGSDETNCGSICRGAQFRCDDGSCLDFSVRCDGVRQCNDGSDEIDCSAITCSTFELKCDFNRCLSPRVICDGVGDCGDRSDEKNCTSCGGGKLCGSGECIGTGEWCDGIPDCSDGSDERRCTGTSTHPTTRAPMASGASFTRDGWNLVNATTADRRPTSGNNTAKDLWTVSDNSATPKKVTISGNWKDPVFPDNGVGTDHWLSPGNGVNATVGGGSNATKSALDSERTATHPAVSNAPWDSRNYSVIFVTTASHMESDNSSRKLSADSVSSVKPPIYGDGNSTNHWTNINNNNNNNNNNVTKPEMTTTAFVAVSGNPVNVNTTEHWTPVSARDREWPINGSTTLGSGNTWKDPWKLSNSSATPVMQSGPSRDKWISSVDATTNRLNTGREATKLSTVPGVGTIKTGPDSKSGTSIPRGTTPVNEVNKSTKKNSSGRLNAVSLFQLLIGGMALLVEKYLSD